MVILFLDEIGNDFVAYDGFIEGYLVVEFDEFVVFFCCR